MRGLRHPLLWPFLAGLVLRVGFVYLEPTTRPIADERTWIAWGIDELGKAHFSPFHTTLIFHAPGFPYFVGLVHAVFGSLLAVKLALAGVGALLVGAVFGLARRLLGEPAAIVAAWITAAYPDLVWFSVHFWAECLFVTLLWWAFERTLAAAETDRARLAALAGVLFGFSVLTRETALYFIPFILAWFWWLRRRRCAVAFALASILIVAPWTWRNWIVFHAFVPVSTQGGLNVWKGNGEIPRDEVYARIDAVQGRIEQFRFATRMGLEAIWRRQPTWFFEKVVEQMPKFWEVESMPLIHLQRGAYGVVSAPVARLVAGCVIVPYLVLLGFFAAGVVSLPSTRAWALIHAFLGYYLLLHIAMYGYSRFRMPLLPLLAIVAAWGALRLRELTPRQRLWAAALGLAFAVTLAPSLRRLAAEPAYTVGVELRSGPLVPREES